MSNSTLESQNHEARTSPTITLRGDSPSQAPSSSSSSHFVPTPLPITRAIMQNDSSSSSSTSLGADAPGSLGASDAGPLLEENTILQTPLATSPQHSTESIEYIDTRSARSQRTRAGSETVDSSPDRRALLPYTGPGQDHEVFSEFSISERMISETSSSDRSITSSAETYASVGLFGPLSSVGHVGKTAETNNHPLDLVERSGQAEPNDMGRSVPTPQLATSVNPYFQPDMSPNAWRTHTKSVFVDDAPDPKHGLLMPGGPSAANGSTLLGTTKRGIPEDDIFWKNYVQEAETHDKETLTNWNQLMDVLLVFAALFSAILTSFLIEFYKLLQPDEQQTTNDLLRNLTIAMQGGGQAQSQFPSSAAAASSFRPSASSVWINALWFSSLTCSLGTAMAAILVKQWLQFYLMNLNTGTMHEIAQRRQHRYNALVDWHVSSIISVLPLVMQLAVILFALGLVIVLWKVNLDIAYLILSLIAIILFCYSISVVLPLFYPSCPYKTSVAVVVKKGIIHAQRLWDQVQQSWRRVRQGDVEAAHKLMSRPNSKLPNPLAESVIKPSEVLEKDSLLWLLNVSHTKEIVDSSLKAISNMDHTPDMVSRFLEHGVLVQLTARACVRLPPRGSFEWKQMHLKEYLKKLNAAVPFMESLIWVWQHQDYVGANPPPAVTYNLIDPSHSWILGDWLYLWRTSYRKNKYMVDQEWDMVSVSAIICIEVIYYQHISAPKHLTRIQEITPSFSLDESNPIHDLYDLLYAQEKYDYQTPEAMGYLLKGMIFFLFRVDLDPELKQETLLLLLQLWKHFKTHQSINHQLLTCFGLLHSKDRDEKRHISDVACDLFHQIIMNQYQQVEMYTPLTPTGSKIISAAIHEFYHAIRDEAAPKKRYLAAFLEIPPGLRDPLIHEIVTGRHKKPKDHKQIEWLTDLLLGWLKNDELNNSQRLEILFHLQALSENSMKIGLGHILETVLQGLQGKLANQLAYMLCNSLQNAVEISNMDLIQQFHLKHGPWHINRFLHSDLVSPEIRFCWKTFFVNLQIWLSNPRSHLANSKADWNTCYQLLINLEKSKSKAKEPPQAPNGINASPDPLLEHMANMTSMSFSSDHTHAVTGAADKTIVVWDVNKEEPIQGPWVGPGDVVTNVAIAPNHHQVAVSSSDHKITIWDTNTGSHLIAINPVGVESGISAMSFSPHSPALVAGSFNGVVQIWDINTGDLQFTIKGEDLDPLTALTFSPDGDFIIGGSLHGQMYFWDHHGRLLWKPERKHSTIVEAVRSIPFGGYILSISQDSVCKVWDLNERTMHIAWVGRPLPINAVAPGSEHVWHPTKRLCTGITCLAYSADEKYVATGSSNAATVCVWKTSTGHKVHKLDGHSGEITAVAFDNSGHYLASGSTDRTIRVWHRSTGVQIRCVGSNISPGENDEENLAYTARVHNQKITAVAFSHDGSLLASGSADGMVCIWNLNLDDEMQHSGNLLAKLPLEGDRGGVESLAFSFGGSYLAAGLSDRTIRVWASETRLPFIDGLRGHMDKVTSMMFTPDDNYILSHSLDKSVRAWNISTQESFIVLVETHTSQ